MDVQEALSGIGLSKNESRLYRALLRMGPSRIGAVCAKTRIHRRNAYDALESLKERGFVSVTTINNRHLFEAAHPKRVLEVLDERRAGVAAALPRLLSQQDAKGSEVRVYTGQGGRRAVFEDKLETEGEQLVLGAHAPSEGSSAFVENYHRRRIQHKIPLRMLFPKSERAAAKRYARYALTRVRVLSEKSVSPIAINVYGEKTALLLGSGALDPATVLIEDAELAKCMRAYFDLLWDGAKPVPSHKKSGA